MHKFDYSFLAEGLFPANLVNLTANIASLSAKADMHKENHKNIFCRFGRHCQGAVGKKLQCY